MEFSYEFLLDKITKNNMLFVLTSLSIVVAGLAKTFDVSNALDFAIGASLCFFTALIVAIVYEFFREKHKSIYVDVFIIVMITLGFANISGIIASLISFTWSGHNIYYIIMMVAFFILFFSVYLDGIKSLNKIKPPYQNKLQKYSKVYLSIEAIIFIIGIPILMVGFGGFIITSINLGQPGGLPQYILFVNLIFKYGLFITSTGLLLWAVNKMTEKRKLRLM